MMKRQRLQFPVPEPKNFLDILSTNFKLDANGPLWSEIVDYAHSEFWLVRMICTSFCAATTFFNPPWPKASTELLIAIRRDLNLTSFASDRLIRWEGGRVPKCCFV